MKLRSWLLVAALVYLTFVVYGSLVPLRYVALPWDDALDRFAKIPYLQLGIGSRADWVANLLLFIPLAYLWLGALWRQGSDRWNVAATLGVVAAGAALSVGIEFVQLYFPQRTVSINDIVAEAAGAVVGVGLWWWTGPAVLRWLEGWAGARDSAGWTSRVLYVYLAVFFAYSVLPLDLTFSPVELWHKWSAGSVILVPFGARYASVADALYDMGGDILVWIPVAVLWRLSGRLSGLQAWTRVVLAALLLETLQLFVYSRITDVTDVITAGLGAVIGVLVGARLARHAPAPAQRAGRLRAWGYWALAFVVWLGVLALVFWYPFELRLEREFVSERLGRVFKVPFVTYYFGSEYRAITEVLHKMLFFMPGGALLAWVPTHIARGPLRNFVLLVVAGLLAALALTVELGQVVLPGKVPDATDWFLETLGGLLGLIVAWHWLARRRAEARAAVRRSDRTRTARDASQSPQMPLPGGH